MPILSQHIYSWGVPPLASLYTSQVAYPGFSSMTRRTKSICCCCFSLVFIIITICKTTYKDIQYTTLLILFAVLTTQYYISFSFTFAHTMNEKKKKKEKKEKEREELLTTFVL